MDKIKFATLIAYIQHLCSQSIQISMFEASEIDKMIAEGSVPDKVRCQDVESLMGAIYAKEKINAIKAYRTLTGMGLKESKDAVEKYGFGVDTQN